MKNHVFAFLVLSILGLTSACTSSPSSISQIKFSCELNNSVWVTFAQTPKRKIQIIRWISDFGKQIGYTPHSRCLEVTQRFQSFHDLGNLNYITTGRFNNQNVICVSQNPNSCGNLLLTLKPGENGHKVIQKLFDVGKYGSGPLEESALGVTLFVDFHKLLSED